MRLSVGKVSKMFGISRTALLYYDKIGLLGPCERSESGYRLYGQADIDRLERIFILKNAGVPLNQINSLLSAEEPVVFGKLMKRLGELNLEIEKLRDYQKQIIHIMNGTSFALSDEKPDADTIEKITSYAEIKIDKREFWHAEFEKQSPELHASFLSLMGMKEK